MDNSIGSGRRNSDSGAGQVLAWNNLGQRQDLGRSIEGRSIE